MEICTNPSIWSTLIQLIHSNKPTTRFEPMVDILTEGEYHCTVDWSWWIDCLIFMCNVKHQDYMVVTYSLRHAFIQLAACIVTVYCLNISWKFYTYLVPQCKGGKFECHANSSAKINDKIWFGDVYVRILMANAELSELRGYRKTLLHICIENLAHIHRVSGKSPPGASFAREWFVICFIPSHYLN